MTKRVIMDDPVFELSKVELERPGPHYTIDTLKQLAEQEPNADVVLLLGGDSLRDLPTWHQPAQLVTAVHKIGVMRRPENSFDLSALEAELPGLREKVTFINTLLQNLSSSEIRRRAAEAEPYRYYVLPAVYEYIESNQLYRKR